MSSQPAVGELVLEGDTITVQCITDAGNPIPTITWTQDGTPLVSSSTETVEDIDDNGSCCNAKKRKSLLTIRVSRDYHNKQYKCSGHEDSSEMFTLLVKCEYRSLSEYYYFIFITCMCIYKKKIIVFIPHYSFYIIIN